MRILALMIVAAVALAACAPKAEEAPTASQPGVADAPFAGGGVPKSGAPTGPDIAVLESNYTTAKGLYEKNPKDAKAKEAFITAAVTYGHESMMSADLDPKVKYRQALRIYREVLKIDPTNEVATKESDLITKIYKQMGREVPTD